MDNAFKFVRDHGIVLESEYPYTHKQGKCEKTDGNFKITGFTDVTNCNGLTNSLASRPTSVAVDASKWSSYKTGVFSDCATKLNHGVLAVGIIDGSWKIKNSWGVHWGEAGFIRLKTGNTCGVCNVASFPTGGK